MVAENIKKLNKFKKSFDNYKRSVEFAETLSPKEQEKISNEIYYKECLNSVLIERQNS
jgi:hypothetical protein